MANRSRSLWVVNSTLTFVLTITLPFWGISNPLIIDNKVDFPDPFLPKSPTTLELKTEKFNPLNTSTSLFPFDQ
jgi:hypothetical protein